MKKNKELFFWVGWTLWISMAIFKVVMVFTDNYDFCWDPMFSMIPIAFIIIGGVDTHCCKCCKQHKEEKDKD